MINRCLIFLYLLACNALQGITQIIPHLTGKLTVEDGLSSNTITDLTQDDNGFLWIATPDGLNRFDGTDIVQYYHLNNTNSLPHNSIYCLKRLTGNYLAIGTQGGLSFYNGNTDSFRNFYYRQNNSLDAYNNAIIGLETDTQGNLWAASRNCIFIFDRQHRLRHTIPSPFTEALAAKERSSFVDKIWPLSNGDVLLSMYNGWKIWSNTSNTLTGFSNFPFLQSLPASAAPSARLFKIFGNYFLCILPGRDSIAIFDEKGRQRSSCYFPYNKYPYISWSQQAVEVDSSRILLLFHNFGMAAIPVVWQDKIPVLSPLSPFLFAASEYKTALRDCQGNWWLATTREGLQKVSPSPSYFTRGHGKHFYFHPDSIIPGQTARTTLITAMRVNGQPCWPDPRRTIPLPAQLNDITIQYTAIDLADGPAIRYAYRLTGVDTGWVMAGRQRQINFSHLAPGHYTFQVRAAGTDGTWSPQAAGVSFLIRPPFIRTTWFYTLLLLATTAIAYSFYRYRIRQVNRTRQIRSEISRNLHDEVGAHLTNISLSSLLAQRQLHNERVVSQLLERIYQDSQMVSESMREIVWSIDPDIDTLGEALPRMLHYAAQLLEARGIELQAEVTPEVERLRLSMQQRRDVYRIFKEAVNNLARHSNATLASVHFECSGDILIMRIADNGSGFVTVTPAEHNGLKNMRERARQHRWNLEVLSRPQQGTTITLSAFIG